MRQYRIRRGMLVHVCALGILAALIAVPEASPIAAATGWTQVPSASETAPPSHVRLVDVQCRTPTSCLAVGRYEDPDRAALPLVGRLTATGWSFRTAPLPTAKPTNYGGQLKAIACATATKCFAVGEYWEGRGQAYITRWDGKTWTSVPTPHPGTESTLAGIACPTSTRCFAVGMSRDGKVRRTLALQWKGTGWGIRPSPTPHPRGGTWDMLDAVECVSAANCIAVGWMGDSYGTPPNPSKTFAMRWDGTAWTVVKTPNPPGNDVSAALFAVACASPTFCFATGSSYSWKTGQTRTLIQRWNGSRWSIVSSPNPAGNRVSYLSGITCPSAKRCFGIGYRSANSSSDRTLLTRWDGTRWAMAPIPAPLYGWHEAISCPSETSCVAVGGILAQRWNGSTWTDMVTGAFSGSFSGVSCANASACVAVGTSHAYPFTPPRGLIQHWNGTRFTKVAPPLPPGTKQFRFASVACPATNTCFAVGTFDDGSGNRPLVERWDGSAWSVMRVPAPSGPGGLSDISCPNATTCFAIGTLDGGGPSTPFVERWDGLSWAPAPAPAPSPTTSRSSFRAISCSSASACLTVGGSSLPARWNGTTWTNISAPNVPGDTGELMSDVACLSTTFCMAVGTTTEWNAGIDSALIARWNGSAWTILTSPTSPDFGHSFLGGVTCTSLTRCVAVGMSTNDYHDADFRDTRTLVEQWNGSTWSIVPSANPPIAGFPHTPHFDSLGDVSCVGATCIAVGTNSNAESSFTLAERSP